MIMHINNLIYCEVSLLNDLVCPLGLLSSKFPLNVHCNVWVLQDLNCFFKHTVAIVLFTLKFIFIITVKQSDLFRKNEKMIEWTLRTCNLLSCAAVIKITFCRNIFYNFKFFFSVVIAAAFVFFFCSHISFMVNLAVGLEKHEFYRKLMFRNLIFSIIAQSKLDLWDWDIITPHIINWIINREIIAGSLSVVISHSFPSTYYFMK